MKSRLSILAEKDLEGIWLFTLENWSLHQADRYINQILDEIEFLAVNPNCAVDYGEVRLGYYKARILAHLIFFRINSSRQELEIIRILHHKMDIESHL